MTHHDDRPSHGDLTESQFKFQVAEAAAASDQGRPAACAARPQDPVGLGPRPAQRQGGQGSSFGTSDSVLLAVLVLVARTACPTRCPPTRCNNCKLTVDGPPRTRTRRLDLAQPPLLPLRLRQSGHWNLRTTVTVIMLLNLNFTESDWQLSILTTQVFTGKFSAQLTVTT